MLVIQTQINRV